MTQHTASGIGAPNFAPPSVSAHYTDTASGQQYLSVDTLSPGDWRLIGETTQLGQETPRPLGTASAGSSDAASREDHVHAMPTAANVGAVATSAVGAANGVASLDSGGKVPTAQLPTLGAAVGSATPQALGTASPGVSANASREDHVHAMPSKADVGLGNVDNTSDLAKPVSTAQQAALDLKIDKSQIGASDGVASLVGGKVPSAQLPSYVDDVLEYATYSALPSTGESGKIYVTLDTNFEYRWSGSAYIQLVASPGTTDALAEGSVNLYFTQARVRAAVLTGIDTSQNAQITAADTVLAALGKAQGQIGAIQSALDTINGTVV